MGKYFIGKGVQLLTEETENKIRIYKLGLLQPEFGHMPCISGNAFTFLLAEEGEIQCQINIRSSSWRYQPNAFFRSAKRSVSQRPIPFPGAI